jgi:hypothetical protein
MVVIFSPGFSISVIRNVWIFIEVRRVSWISIYCREPVIWQPELWLWDRWRDTSVGGWLVPQFALGQTLTFNLVGAATVRERGERHR